MAEEDAAGKDEDAAGKDEDAESSGGIKGLITKITSSKKMMIIVGGGALLLILIIGGATYYFLSGDETEKQMIADESLEKEGQKEGQSDEKKVAKAMFESVHIFPLKPFFFPIKLSNNQESGHFLSVTPNFRMSNSNLNSEIYKKLPLIREKMYTILRQATLKDLTKNNIGTQEKIKNAVRDRTNELLPVGSGVVKEVFFSQFIIK